MTLFRYPGGKSKTFKEICALLSKGIDSHYYNYDYREPFFGSGSVGFYFIETFYQNLSSIWINDKDKGIASIWNAIINMRSDFKESINYIIPSVEKFNKTKQKLLEDNYCDLLSQATDKIVAHQMSYSGLGTQAGPIGGRLQRSSYNVGCRWNPQNLATQIDKLYDLFFNKIGSKLYEGECTSLDYQHLLKNTSDKTILYLDPPYLHKGNDLYQVKFSKENHNDLRNTLKTLNCWWVLSYDDCPEIREMYDWANINEMSVKYTARISNRRDKPKQELLICPQY